MNSFGLKDGTRYRVSNTMALENVGPALAPFLSISDMIGTMLRKLNHGYTTANNNMLTIDLTDTYKQKRKQRSRV
jgi:hypothetical protein